MTDWSENYRNIKRKLSVMEKGSLTSLHNQGKAIVLPGSPGTEVEELVAVGFDPSHIYGIEQDPDIAEMLYDHYFDLCNIHIDEVGAWMRRAHNKYTYIHLDFCGQLKNSDINSLQGWRRLPDQIARMRVTVVESRRMEEQKEFEIMLRRQLFGHLIDQAKFSDRVAPERWDKFLALLDQTPLDSTQLIAGIGLLNFMFGLEVWQYTDRAVINVKGPLPQPQGTHVITDIHRFCYSEEGHPVRMLTVWLDLLPIATSAHRHEGWVVDEVAKAFHLMYQPIVVFNPEHYRGDNGEI